MVGKVSTGDRVAGKIALVTGGARGLGRATAEMLADQGAHVFVSDVDGAEASACANDIGAAAWFLQDVTEPDTWDVVLDTIERSHGSIDILVNNAGIALSADTSRIETVSLTTWNSVIAVNVTGTLLGCQQALRRMRHRGGSIVNVASIAASLPTPTIAPYGASKAAVVQLTRSVAAAGAPSGIRCNAVSPGIVATAMVADLQAYHAEAPTGAAAEVLSAVGRAVPLGGYQAPQDVAAAVLYLASDEARSVTGAQLIVDGGMTMR